MSHRNKTLHRFQLFLSFSTMKVGASFKGSKDLPNGPVFIVGTGRSGTHFLCRSLISIAGLSDYYGGVESPHLFWDIALKTYQGQRLTKTHFEYYKTLMKLVYPRLLVDQTHPNLWHAEELLNAFPSAKFLALSRNVYSVVNSMLSHKGTSSWIDHEKDFRPNKFLGITTDNRITYKNNYSRIQKFTCRWLSHEKEIERITSKFPLNVMRVKYENLVLDMKEELRRICSFLDTSLEYSALPQANQSSLYKQNLLTSLDKEQIQQYIACARGADT